MKQEKVIASFWLGDHVTWFLGFRKNNFFEYEEALGKRDEQSSQTDIDITVFKAFSLISLLLCTFIVNVIVNWALLSATLGL